MWDLQSKDSVKNSCTVLFGVFYIVYLKDCNGKSAANAKGLRNWAKCTNDSF